MSTHPVSGLGPAAPQPTVGGQTPQFAPPLEEKNASRVRLIEAIRKVGIRPFNDFCCAHSQARIVQARCGWSALNGRIPTFRCGWWQKQTGVFFFHPRPAGERDGWATSLDTYRICSHKPVRRTPEISTLRFAVCGFPKGK